MPYRSCHDIMIDSVSWTHIWLRTWLLKKNVLHHSIAVSLLWTDRNATGGHQRSQWIVNRTLNHVGFRLRMDIVTIIVLLRQALGHWWCIMLRLRSRMITEIRLWRSRHTIWSRTAWSDGWWRIGLMVQTCVRLNFSVVWLRISSPLILIGLSGWAPNTIPNLSMESLIRRRWSQWNPRSILASALYRRIIMQHFNQLRSSSIQVPFRSLSNVYLLQLQIDSPRSSSQNLNSKRYTSKYYLS